MSYDVRLEADLGGPEPIRLDMDWNYTSNVAPMWRKAMPDTDGLAGMDGMKARQAIRHLRPGIERMAAAPEEYKALNPENGWGDYMSQLIALRELLAAFAAAPYATVRVWR